jgi:hypothetical protein
MSNKSKNLIIITTMFLVKTTDNKMSLIALKRTVRAGLDLVDPLTNDLTDTWGTDTRPHVPVCSRAAISSVIACCHSGLKIA